LPVGLCGKFCPEIRFGSEFILYGIRPRGNLRRRGTKKKKKKKKKRGRRRRRRRSAH
jgi:hypothetical protein